MKHIETLDEFNQILKDAGDKLVVIDFTATWCGPCRNIAPFFEDLAKQNPDVLFFKVDVDDAQDIAAFCAIKCMPTFLFYKNNTKIHEFSGANKDTLAAKVSELKA
ncbi:thioredoxin-like [Microcaecilia unicolor]|uniref:Thioredoxin n=1 Tax=Microcaecilia unicolor TaxID=1415580 RepID=A0A6P7XAT5_9AMPH|nr:thioredoxin-like [Microcaecilia unicolor]